KSAFTGNEDSAAISRQCASIMSRETKAAPSGSPLDHANPADVVASALKPTCSRYIADPTSHGFGSTKQPESCNARNFSMADCCLLIASQRNQRQPYLSLPQSVLSVVD